MSAHIKGLVLKQLSGFYYVQGPCGNVYECKLRGKIKDQVVTGDRVLITPLSHDKGILEKILPRDNLLYRPKIANVSTVLIIMAADQPAPSLILLDRLLVLAFYNDLKPCIVVNKCDISPHNKAQLITDYYPRANLKVIKTSARNRCGIDNLKAMLKGEIAVMAGPSGVGKSSLLNALLTVDVKTQEVSKKIGRGKHTTRHVELFPLDLGGWIADTPGFSVLDIPNMPKHNLAGYFSDFTPYIAGCRFRDCLHHKETECGVKEAVKEGIIAQPRYDNYLTMLDEVIKNERCYR